MITLELQPVKCRLYCDKLDPPQEILSQSVAGNFACVVSAGTEIKHAKLHTYTYDKDFVSLIFANKLDSAAYS